MYDIGRFTLKDMTMCAGQLRTVGLGAKSMEEAANRVARLLYENLVDGRSGESACALVRVFKTHPCSDLDSGLQTAARDLLQAAP